MTTRHIGAAAAAALILSFAGSAQSASDLLQKGIHAQEAAGDLDGAILIFRQVASKTDSNNNGFAAQAQYQLVLCMLQKGDRPAASKELAALERNFPLRSDLIRNARKLIPGTAALLPAPWGESECAQLNIKREGVATGEYLYYSADVFAHTLSENNRQSYARTTDYSQRLPNIIFQWQLKTKKTTRSIRVRADHDTMKPLDKPAFTSDDDLGDPLAAPFAGPATDVEQSVFLMRRLPLAVGYKTTLPVTANDFSPKQMGLTVTGIETVQTPAGKFNAYKVSFADIGQTFWIGVEGSRPLVKFQSGRVEAELVKVWGPENLLSSLEALAQSAGAKLEVRDVGPGKSVQATLAIENSGGLHVTVDKIYTPPAEIAQALQRVLAEKTNERHLNPLNDYQVRDGSLQTRLIGGKQALSCLLDYQTGPSTAADTTQRQQWTLYVVWIATESAFVELSSEIYRPSVGSFRWRFDPIVNAVRIP